MQPHDNIGDMNVERLIGASYKPEQPTPEFAQRVNALMQSAAQSLTSRAPVPAPAPRPAHEIERLRKIRFRLGWAMAAAACVAAAMLALHALDRPPREPPQARDGGAISGDAKSIAKMEANPGLTPKPRSIAIAEPPIAVGAALTTKPGERRRVVLADGSVLYLNANTDVKYVSDRRVQLIQGEVYVEVAPREVGAKGAAFVVDAPGRKVQALGTHFSVWAAGVRSGVAVMQGTVQVSGLEALIHAGQQLAPGGKLPEAAPRASHVLDWTRELMCAAESPLVPRSQHAGGSLIAVDPSGQETKLTMRKYHVDVHIEDGFARTTIDQTYFNETYGRLEGTFYFPLPADATLSRLAMYVKEGGTCKLMEGGMAERDHARNVFETILHMRRDPALLEWVDGSTFKMRVFPLEPREEKRLLLSYTQKPPGLHGALQYRIPAGHSLEAVGQWSLEARVKNGNALRCFSPSHPGLKIKADGLDMLMTLSEKNARLKQDVVLGVVDPSVLPLPSGERAGGEGIGDPTVLPLPSGERAGGEGIGAVVRFSSIVHENAQYLMLRYRPKLVAQTQNDRRDWVFLFEASGNRDPLLARAQIDVIRGILENCEHDDTFTILTANTRVHYFDKTARPATPHNVAEGLKFLETVHLIGALDLGQAFNAAQPILANAKNPYLVHVGSGIATIGQRNEAALLKQIPSGAKYIGVGVGKQWSRSFMKQAAERSGGFFTQINPDEAINWRAFDLVATLNTPRLMGVSVSGVRSQESGVKGQQVEKSDFVCLTDVTTLADGEELCAVTKIDVTKSGELPEKLVVKGKLAGKEFVHEIKVQNIRFGAGYLPRQWAKLELDRLLAEDAEKNKPAIIELSKQSYVMTPFTSLLVLETEADYAKYNVDRGRKDHWAMYQCPEKIPVVFEGNNAKPQAAPADPKKAEQQKVLSSILVRTSPQLVKSANWPYAAAPATMTADVCYAGAAGVPFEMAKVVTLQGLHSNIDENEVVALVYPMVSLHADSFAPGVKKMMSSFGQVIPLDETNQLVLIDTVATLRLIDRVMRDIEDREVSAAPKPKRPPLNPLGIDGKLAFPGLMPNEEWKTNRGLGVNLGNGVKPDVFGIPGLSLDLAKRKGFSAAGSGVGGGMGGGIGGGMGGGIGGGAAGGKGINADIKGPRLPVTTVPLTELSGLVILAKNPNDLSEVLNIIRDINAANGKPIAGFGSGSPIQKTNPFAYYYANPLAAGLGSNVTLGSHDAFLGKDKTTRGEKLSFITPMLPGGGQNKTIAGVSQLTQQKAPSITVFNGQPTTINVGWELSFLDELSRRAALVYAPPSFTADPRIFGDLLWYAPGMNTTLADVQAVLEAEVPKQSLSERINKVLDELLPNPLKPANKAQVLPEVVIDAEARKLIDKARGLGWQQLAIDADGRAPAFAVYFNGAGQFAWDRVLDCGLPEQVICDGATLWHLYPEIGLGAKRPVSRFHRAELEALLPWLVPNLDDLARGQDVRLVDKNVVGLLPRKADKAKDEKGLPVPFVQINLVFAEDGRLAERQTVLMPNKVVLSRQQYAVDGTITVLDPSSDKVLGGVKIPVAPAKAPNLIPAVKDVVVVPMPLRTKGHWEAKLKGQTDLAKYDADTAIGYIAANCCLNDGPSRTLANDVFGQRFHAQGDHRLGFYVLLASGGVKVDPKQGFHWGAGQKEFFLDVKAEHPKSALAEYLAHHFSQSSQFGEIAGPADGFIQRLAKFRDLWYGWQSGGYVFGTGQDVDKHRLRSLEFLGKSPLEVYDWALLVEMSRRGVGNDAKVLAEMDKAPKLFADNLALSFSARYEIALGQIKYDAKNEAHCRQMLRNLYLDTLQLGIVPPLDRPFRDALAKAPAGGGEQRFGDLGDLLRQSADILAKRGQRLDILTLARQAQEFGDLDIAGDLLLRAVHVSELGLERNIAQLAAVQFFMQTKQLAQADLILQELLAAEPFMHSAALWRTAAEIAGQRNQPARAVAYLDKALDLEYRDLPPVVDLQAIRYQHGMLLTHYQEMAQAFALLEQPATKEFVTKVVRTADRWRAIDPDPTQVCMLTGKILQTAGAVDLAWDYLTTPLSAKPNESAPWLNLAKALQSENSVTLADRAFAQAYDAEPTNAQILWDRAANLSQAGRSAEARALYQTLADGQWQERFLGIQNQARGKLGGH